MNSAEEFYNYWSNPYRYSVPWHELNKETREYWESRWVALQERKERMRGHETD